MAQRSPVRKRRALIVEDETLIATALAEDMRWLGFESCDLATDALRRLFASHEQ
jgi:hypothetical protein